MQKETEDKCSGSKAELHTQEKPTSEHLRSNFRQKLKQLRKSRRLTQVQLAQIIGVSNKSYSKWETGETEPSVTQLLRLAEYFEVPPAVFWEAEDPKSVKQIIEPLYQQLQPEEAIQRSFEIQFHAIRGLASNAFKNRAGYNWGNPVSVPENRVNSAGQNKITGFLGPDVVELMYNGTDANIAFSLLPHEEAYHWLVSERENLAQYFRLLSDENVLKCLVYLANSEFSANYTAAYISEKTDLSEKNVQGVLNSLVEMQICGEEEVHMGEQRVTLYHIVQERMPFLMGILTLAHLALPENKQFGCGKFGMFSSRIRVENEREPEIEEGTGAQETEGEEMYEQSTEEK